MNKCETCKYAGKRPGDEGSDKISCFVLPGYALDVFKNRVACKEYAKKPAELARKARKVEQATK